MSVSDETWILDVVINSFQLFFFQLFLIFNITLRKVNRLFLVHFIFQNWRFNEHKGLVLIYWCSNAWYWKFELFLFLIKHHFVQLDHFSNFDIFFFVFLQRTFFLSELACYILTVVNLFSLIFRFFIILLFIFKFII
jgi:hypothetical protein